MHAQLRAHLALAQARAATCSIVGGRSTDIGLEAALDELTALRLCSLFAPHDMKAATALVGRSATFGRQLR